MGSERRSSSFSSGVITGVPDVTLATTTTSGITSAFSTLSNSCVNSSEAAAVGVAAAAAVEESPDLVAIDSSRGACASYYSCGSGPKSSMWAGNSSKVYKQPTAGSWMQAGTKRSTSEGFHSLYQDKPADEQLYSPAGAGGSRPGSRGSTPSARRHLQLFGTRFGLDDNLQM